VCRVANDHDAVSPASAAVERRLANLRRSTTATATATAGPVDAVLTDRVEAPIATTADASAPWRERVASEILIAAATTTRVIDLRSRDREGQSWSASSASSLRSNVAVATRAATSGTGERHAARVVSVGAASVALT
jgi:Tfp pilus tip-associated adhesin PilY1